MKKISILLLMFVLFLGLSGCGKKKDETNNNNNQQEESIYNEDGTIKDIDEVVEDETEVKQGDLEFSQIKITSLGATNTVSATVTNKGSKTLSFKAILYLKNKDGRILGKVDKTVENLSASKSEKIEISIMGDYTTVSQFEVVTEILK